MQITEPEINVDTAGNLGLSPTEFERIKKLLGRTPNFTELSVFSVLWSEQCSNKNSIKWLKTLPRDHKRFLTGPRQDNRGLVNVGDGWACAFKIQSNFQLSTPEAYQAAAAGISEIHREIFSTGAQPVAALSSLRLGDPKQLETKHLPGQVARRLIECGHSLGVPMFAGEVYFDDSFYQSVLVNVMSVGLAKIGQTVSARADEPGNPVFLAGSRTGKKSTHSAVIAAASLLDNNEENLPSEQSADPHREKLLLEACLEAVKSEAVVGMQSLATAGIAGAAAGMSARSETGMTLHLDKVPTSQDNMRPWETLLSGSGQRIFIVGKAGMENSLYGVFAKWDVELTQIGEVTDTGLIEFYFENEKIAEIPADSLVSGGDAPVYDRDFARPAYLSQVARFNINQVKSGKNLKEEAKKLFTSHNLVSRRWIYEQYNSMVLSNNLSTNALSDAAVLHIKDSVRALAVSVEGNSNYVYADSYTGSMIAVAGAARNIVCSGGVPVAITSCLNFGDPFDPEVYYQFVHVVKGIGDTCRKFDTPVASENVSFYNQVVVDGKNLPIHPTPVIGMLGVLEDAGLHTTLDFKSEGDLIYMLGNCYNDLGSSEYLRIVHGVRQSPAPAFDLHEEFEIQSLVKKLIRKKIVRSAHGVSEGGLFTNLLESAIAGGWGFNVETVETFRKECFLFGESQSRIVITISPEQEDELQNYLINNNVSFTKLGEVFGTGVLIDEENFGSVSEWKRISDNTLSELFAW